MTNIVQSIFHLHELSFLPTNTLGRRGSVAGCSLPRETGNKDLQRFAEWTVANYQAVRGSLTKNESILVHTACSAWEDDMLLIILILLIIGFGYGGYRVGPGWGYYGGGGVSLILTILLILLLLRVI
jgi:hypothetical protein